MAWKPQYETVIQVSQRELDLFATGDKDCVFDKFRHPLPRGIVRSGEFPVAVVRLLYEALGFQSWFSGQAVSGPDTYLLTRLPEKRRQENPAYQRIKDAFGAEVIRRFDKTVERCRKTRGIKTAGGDPDLFVFHRTDPTLRFFVECKLENFTRKRPYRDVLGDNQLFLFPLIQKHLGCPVRIARVQVVDVG